MNDIECLRAVCVRVCGGLGWGGTVDSGGPSAVTTNGCQDRRGLQRTLWAAPPVQWSDGPVVW